MTNTPSDSERPHGFTDPSIDQSSRQPPLTPRNLNSDFEVEGDLVPTPEEQALLRKMRAEKLAKEKGKVSAQEQAGKEAQLRVKKREVDAVKLNGLGSERELGEKAGAT